MELRGIGPIQRYILLCLRTGPYPGGWIYGSHSYTVRTLESLVKRGLVVKTEIPNSPGAYRYTLKKEEN